MKTDKLYITSCSDVAYIDNKCNNYLYAFHFLYKNLELSVDDDFINHLKNKYNLNDIEFRSLKSDVFCFVERSKSIYENKKVELEDLKEELEKDSKETKKENKLSKSEIFKIHKKISQLEKYIKDYDENPTNCVFGSKRLLRNITNQHNKKHNIEKQLLEISEVSDDKELINKLNEDLNNCNQLIDKYSKQYQDKRKNTSFYLLGEANYKGNRFVKLLKIENGILYLRLQIKKGECVYIECKVNNKRRQRELKRLIELAELKEISLSYTIDKEYVRIAYDEEILYGFNFNDKEYRQAIKEIKQQRLTKEELSEKAKECKRQFYIEQEDRKLKDKNRKRCISVDLNPDDIGVTVLEKTVEYEDIDETVLINNDYYKVIDVRQYDLSYYSQKTHKES